MNSFPGKIFRKVQKALNSKYLPYLVLGVFIFLAYLEISDANSFSIRNLEGYSDRGEALIAAVEHKTISYSMPLTGILSAFFEYHLNLPVLFSCKIFFLILLAMTLRLAQISAEALCSRAGGVFALAAAGILFLKTPYLEFEQMLYAFSVALCAYLLILKFKKPSMLQNILAGLSLGFSLLIRSPLFLLPPVILLVEGALFLKKKFNFTRQAVFLLSSYVLLLPWLGVNWKLHKKIIFFEKDKAVCNIITGAMGSVFTMEGDSRKLAGLGQKDSVYKWAAEKILKEPGVYFSAVLRRLWQVFLFYPVTMLFLLAAAIFIRKKDILYFSMIPLYFTGIHCLLSIEQRYFFPLQFLLSVPTGCFMVWSLRLPAKNGEMKTSNLPSFFALALVCIAEFFLITYPIKSKTIFSVVGPGGVESRWLLKKKAELFFGYNMQREGVNVLKQVYSLNPSKERFVGALLKILKSKTSEEMPNENLHARDYELRLLKMLKSLELNEIEKAKELFSKAENVWQTQRNGLRRIISARDEIISRRIKATNKIIYDQDIYNALFYFPIDKRRQIIERLGKITRLTPKIMSLTKEDNLMKEEFDYNNAFASYISSIAGYAEKICPARFLKNFMADMETAKKNPGFFNENLGKAKTPEFKKVVNLYLAIGDRRQFSAEALRLSHSYPENAFYALVCAYAECDRGSEKNLLNNKAYLLSSADYFSLKDKKAALSALNRLKTKNLKPNEMEKMALICQNAGKYADALKIFDNLVSRNPQKSAYYNGRGVVLRFLGKNEKAEKDFKKALSLNPDSAEVRMNRASALLSLGKKREALKLYREILNSPAGAELKKIARKEIEKIR